VQRKLLACRTAKTLLEAVGFVETVDGFLVLNGVVDGRVRDALDAVREARRGGRRAASNDAPEAWTSPRPVVELDPPPTGAQRVDHPTDDWTEIFGLDNVKRELQELMSLTSGAVILLYGPPGCGKTPRKSKLARCAAKNYGRGAIVTAYGAEVQCRFSRSHRLHCYGRARDFAPCVLLVKGLGGELLALVDAIARVRTPDDGIVVIVTNSEQRVLTPRSDDGTYAMKIRRTCRASGLEGFDRLIHVPLPSKKARLDAIRATVATRRHRDLDLEDLAAQME
ncbi:hypothetical protein CTAYLR_006782, partial [Chrysophaeum taylorii]